jgi:hypothetical protein
MKLHENQRLPLAAQSATRAMCGVRNLGFRIWNHETHETS